MPRRGEGLERALGRPGHSIRHHMWGMMEKWPEGGVWSREDKARGVGGSKSEGRVATPRESCEDQLVGAGDTELRDGAHADVTGWRGWKASAQEAWAVRTQAAWREAAGACADTWDADTVKTGKLQSARQQGGASIRRQAQQWGQEARKHWGSREWRRPQGQGVLAGPAQKDCRQNSQSE